MQPQIAVALALAKGSSMVTESIFENRFKYVDELNRMGAIARWQLSAVIATTPTISSAKHPLERSLTGIERP